MYVNSKAIVLSSIKFQEKSLIVKCFTKELGVRSYFVPNAFSGKKNAQRIAYFQPLSIIEIVAIHKNKGALEYIKELKIAYAYQKIYSNIVKSSIILFLSEILNYCIVEENSNEALFEYIETSLILLDNQDSNPNFHLIFLLQLSKFLGFYPQENKMLKPYFEVLDGMFVDNPTVSCLSLENSKLFYELMQLKISSNNLIFTVYERQVLLKIILDYFSVHLDTYKVPNSIDVLRAVFE